ncbi:MAG: putative 2OG-Fe(II) oxygenase [Candidatus Poseidoniales archaeon]
MNLKTFSIEKVDINQETQHSLESVFLSQIYMMMQSPSVEKSNIGGWQSDVLKLDYNDVDHPLHGIYEASIQKLGELTSDMKVRPSVSCNVSFYYWVNVNYRNDMNSFHHHVSNENTILSGCYYLKKPRNSGNIIFRDDSSYYRTWFSDEFDTEISIGEGECIVFPPYRLHGVQPNFSDDVRISVAFNLAFD